MSFADFEKDEKATRERLAKDRERASEAAAAARRDERRRRSGGDDVVVVDDEGDLARGYKTTDDGRRRVACSSLVARPSRGGKPENHYAYLTCIIYLT